MTQPRRVLIGWDYAAHGIWWVLTKEEKRTPASPGRRSATPPRGWHERSRPWSDRLSSGLLDDLQAWNDACAAAGAGAPAGTAAEGDTGTGASTGTAEGVAAAVEAGAATSARVAAGASPQGLQERGRDLAIRVQDELGTDGWEVLYQLGGRMFRVHPQGSWPIESWRQDLLGYGPGPPRRSG